MNKKVKKFENETAQWRNKYENANKALLKELENVKQPKFGQIFSIDKFFEKCLCREKCWKRRAKRGN